MDIDAILNTAIASAPANAPPTRERTPQQQAFINQVKSTRNNILLSAVAGSGKTFTLVEAMKDYPTSAFALAFNKRNAEDLAKRMPPTVTCKTFNGLGHGAIAAKLGRKLRLNAQKLADLVKPLPQDLKNYYWDHPEVRQMVNLIRSRGHVPHSCQGVAANMTDYDWHELCEELEVDEKHRATVINFATKLIQADIAQAWQGIVDFDDQLYISIIFNCPFPRPNLVIVDEAQDLSPIQHAMVKKMGCRVIAAGDPYQAIYGFRGAAFDSLKRMTNEFSMTEMPLTVSFRCPKTVVESARKYVPHIEAAPGAPAGMVIELKEFDPDAIKPGHVVICRKNAPLISMFFALLKQGKPSVILGRDIGQGLKKLCLKFEGTPMENFEPALVQWKQIELANAMDKPAKAHLILDKFDAIMTVVRNRKPATVRALAEMFEELFRDEKANITLSSIHKAKGMEFMTVHFFGFEECPLRFRDQTDDEFQQEINLCYVAVTRSMDVLYFHPLPKAGEE